MNLKRNKIKAPIVINNLIGNIKKDKGECKIKFYLASFSINLLLIILIIGLRNLIPPEVPLFYGLPEGEKQLASWWLLTTPALITILFTATNLVICKKISNTLIKQISTYLLIPLNFFSTIAIIKIILLVSSF